MFILLLFAIVHISYGQTEENYQKMGVNEMVFPKILRLEGKQKKLLYFGTYHSNQPQDSLFDKIKASFMEFKPKFVLHEGGTNWPIYTSIDSTIRVSGEPGYFIKLAQAYNLPYSNLEPTEISEFTSLQEQFKKGDILLMYICRQIDQQQRINQSNTLSDREFERNMTSFLQYLNAVGISLSERELKFSYWKDYYAEFFQESLDWRNFDPSNYYPNFFKNTLNEINRASDTFRNKHMIETILQGLERYDRVMVVVGGGHLLIQEEELTQAFHKLYSEK